MTSEDFRRLVAELPGTIESSHMGHADFRVNGKIFATLNKDETLGMVQLTPEQQRYFMTREAGLFVPCAGKWGEKGSTNIRLESAGEDITRDALETALQNVLASIKKK